MSALRAVQFQLGFANVITVDAQTHALFFRKSRHYRENLREHMHVVMAIDMSRQPTKTSTKRSNWHFSSCSISSNGRVPCSAISQIHLPNSPLRAKFGIGDSGRPSVNAKCIPTDSPGFSALRAAACSTLAELTSAVVDVTTPFLNASIMP